MMMSLYSTKQFCLSLTVTFFLIQHGETETSNDVSLDIHVIGRVLTSSREAVIMSDGEQTQVNVTCTSRPSIGASANPCPLRLECGGQIAAGENKVSLKLPRATLFGSEKKLTCNCTTENSCYGQMEEIDLILKDADPSISLTTTAFVFLIVVPIFSAVLLVAALVVKKRRHSMLQARRDNLTLSNQSRTNGSFVSSTSGVYSSETNYEPLDRNTMGSPVYYESRLIGFHRLERGSDIALLGARWTGSRSNLVAESVVLRSELANLSSPEERIHVLPNENDTGSSYFEMRVLKEAESSSTLLRQGGRLNDTNMETRQSESEGTRNLSWELEPVEDLYILPSKEQPLPRREQLTEMFYIFPLQVEKDEGSNIISKQEGKPNGVLLEDKSDDRSKDQSNSSVLFKEAMMAKDSPPMPCKSLKHKGYVNLSQPEGVYVDVQKAARDDSQTEGTSALQTGPNMSVGAYVNLCQKEGVYVLPKTQRANKGADRNQNPNEGTPVESPKSELATCVYTNIDQPDGIYVAWTGRDSGQNARVGYSQTKDAVGDESTNPETKTDFRTDQSETDNSYVRP